MQNILELASEFPDYELEAGTTLLNVGDNTGRLYVLVEGTVEVYRDDVTIAFVDEPGAIFGEMSLLLNITHTANVRAASAVTVKIIEDALELLQQRPRLIIPIAQLLARRLQNANSYLVDLKRQFADQGNHLSMVDKVLESMSHQQARSFTPIAELPGDPWSEATPEDR
jgi:CRP/FNR family cyclic AMP-dependent transcriptional regulator